MESVPLNNWVNQIESNDYATLSVNLLGDASLVRLSLSVLHSNWNSNCELQLGQVFNAWVGLKFGIKSDWVPSRILV